MTRLWRGAYRRGQIVPVGRTSGRFITATTQPAGAAREIPANDQDGPHPGGAVGGHTGGSAGRTKDQRPVDISVAFSHYIYVGVSRQGEP
jgi:hypothetical protein